MKKIIVISLLFIVVNIFAQKAVPSSTENYTFSTIYLSEDKSKKIESIQYFDGLGRAKQNLLVKATTLGKDLVIPTEYDNMGRRTKSYLPLPQNSLSGAIQPISGTTVNNYYGISNAYSEIVLDDSPLNRITESAFPGQDWIKSGGNTIQNDYDINISSDNVKKFSITTSWDSVNKIYTSSIPSTSTYGAGELYKYKITDEDKNVVYVFKDKLGRVVLNRKNDGVNDINTYYVYNDYNQQVYIVPPLASAKGTLTQTDLDELCYQYRYDDKNRLAEKKLPGKGLNPSTGIWIWESMVYDNQDRLVMTQDANRKQNNEWFFTKYDQLGRIAYTGISAGGTRITEQTNVNAKGNNNVTRTTTSGFTAPGLLVYYDNIAANNYPNTFTTILSINYYDTYPTGSPTIPTTILTQDVLQHNAQNSNISTKSLLTASFVKNIDNSAWTKTYIWYNAKGKAIGSHSVNHLGGYTKMESLLDFTGVTQQMYTKHKRKSADTELVIKEDFEYDSQNRLLKHYHEVIGKSPKELLTQNHYNEIGQLDWKKVGATTVSGGISPPLQTIDYQYNIRGWLTKINDISNIGTDIFAYTINYNTLDITTTKPYVADQSFEIKKRFNGTISQVDWLHANPDPNNRIKSYGYSYDGLDRLKAGFYFIKFGGQYLFTEEHNELVKYDVNGNIDKLKRFSYYVSTAPNKIDDLSYNYTGNRLTSITDSSGNASGYEGGGNPISYDDNGNMTIMLDKGISSISYNYLDLPTNIAQGSRKKTEYKYRADGVKIKKTFTLINQVGTTIINTEYLDGFQYSTPNTDPIRKALKNPDDSTLEAARAGEEEAFSEDTNRKVAIVGPGNPSVDDLILSFFPTSEGYYDYENFRYIYQYKDQVGNIRVSYTKDSNGAIQIMDTNDYYPFGMSHLKSTQSVYDPMSIPYNYKFGSKELQETGMYDFGARMYLPDVGRWFNVDPLAELRPDLTPFRYGFNNPISFTDPTGMYEGDDDRGDGDGECSCHYDYDIEEMREWHSDNMNDFQADLEAEYQEEMQDGMEGPEKRKQRDIEERNETLSLLLEMARDKADTRNFNGFGPDEVPVSFFGKDDKAVFHKVYKEMYDLFKDTKGDGIFRVYSHGNFGRLFNGEDEIRDAKTFDAVMSSKNKNWSNVDNMKDPILILFACLSGISTTQNEAIGKQISKAHPNLTVIAFNGFVTYDTKANGIKNINAGQDKADGRGVIVFYRNGKYLTGYQYNQFLKKYPNFK